MPSSAYPREPEVRTLIRRVFKEQAKESSLTLSVLRAHWSGIVGEGLAQRTWPLRVRRDTLWIGAPDACWAYELQFHKRELLSSVQAFLESTAVRELRFSPGERPEPSEPSAAPPRLERAEPPSLDPGSARALEQAAGNIADDRLRQAFRRSLAKQKSNRTRRAAASR